MRVCGLYAGQISRRVAGAADWWAWCGLKDKEVEKYWCQTGDYDTVKFNFSV